MTSELDIVFTLVAPTAVAQRPTSPGQPVTSLGYIPGTALRGALASRWLAGRTPRDLVDDEAASFQRIFGGRQVQFGAALPRKSREYETWIVPRSAWAQKTSGGWRSDISKSGVVDALPLLLAQTDADPDELNDLDPFGEPFAAFHVKGRSLFSLSVPRRMLARGAIQPPGESPIRPTRGVAARGQLYFVEAIDSGQQFAGSLRGDDALLESLIQYARLDWTSRSKDARLRIGSHRNVGDGAADIFHIPPKRTFVQRSPQEVEKAVRRFTAQIDGQDSERIYLPVTLESDVVLRDDLLLTCTNGDPRAAIHRYQSGIPAGMELVLAMQSSRWIGGWDMVRGLPRAPHIAVEQGSEWVYSVPNEPAKVREAVEWWLRFEKSGLGEFVELGLGRVKLLHPFHTKLVGEVW